MGASKIVLSLVLQRVYVYIVATLHFIISQHKIVTIAYIILIVRG
jgi:hypothetical protein